MLGKIVSIVTMFVGKDFNLVDFGCNVSLRFGWQNGWPRVIF